MSITGMGLCMLSLSTLYQLYDSGANTPRLIEFLQTGEKTDIEVKKGERVISEETANDILSMMESVVADGTGRNSQVKGYRIGGKTGTSEDGVNTGKYVTSFVGVAPISEPGVVVLITLYNPTGEGGHQGGGVAAPIGAKIFGEVLPYLEVQKDNLSEEDIVVQVEIPDITGKTIKEAKSILLDSNLQISINNEYEGMDENSVIITNQTPSAGIKVNSGSNIYVDI